MKHDNTNSSYWLIFATILVGLMLVMIPLPNWLRPFRPDWVALIIIYWSMSIPTKAGLGIAFIAGLLLDVTLGTLLGQHALGLVIVAFIVLKLHQRMRVYPIVQQCIIVMLLLIIKQLAVLWVDGMIGRAPNSLLLYFTASVIGALIWLWVYAILRNLRRKFSPL